MKSSTLSSDKAAPTWRAATETIAAILVALYMAVTFDTFRWFAISCCVAPLLLLRSEKSQALGAKWFSSWMSFCERQNLIVRAISVLLLPLIATFIRLIATLKFIKNGIWEFPSNWRETVWSKSIFATLEFVPGSGGVLANIDNMRLPYGTGILLSFTSFPLFILANTVGTIGSASWLSTLFFVVAGTMLGVGLSFLAPGIVAWVGLVLAISYRFSLKSTALIWLSLLFALNESRYSEQPNLLLVRERRAAIWGLIRAASFATIALMLFKIILLPTIESWHTAPWATVFNTYLTPGAVYPWQIAAFLNALLTLIWYYHFLDNAERNFRSGKWTTIEVARWFKIFYVTRATLSTYTIPVLLLITLNASQTLTLDISLVTKPLPFDKPSEVMRLNE